MVYERARDYIDFTRPPNEVKQSLQEWMYHGDTGTHTVKWGTRRGKQRYKTIRAGEVGQHTTRGDRIIDKMVDPVELRVEIDKVEYFKTRKIEDQINPLKSRVGGVEISELKVSLVDMVNTKEIELKETRLTQKGKIETLHRDRLKRATTQSDIRLILGEARTEVTEKGYDRLLENAEVRRDELKL